MFNKVILVGNLTRDIELRYSQAGMAIAKTAIATSRKFTSNGEKKEEVMFIDITFFGRSGEVANQYLRRGSKILVEGRLNFEQWVDQNGQKRSKHSVTVETMQMLDSRADSQNMQMNQSSNPMNQQGMNQGMAAGGAYGANSYDAGSAQSYNQQTQPSNDFGQQSSYTQQQQPAREMPTQEIPSIDIDEDEIPF
jgi:single-strand DNA-binding protein